ncbi:MAG: hypothetical protein ACREBE_12200 [bacterium]
MRTILRWLAILVGMVVLAIGSLFVAARFHDGPLGPIPGGALRSGAQVDAPVSDWKFATDVQTIEMQLANESSSRTTWILVHDGRAFIPVSLAYPPGKRWHKAADQNGAAWIRIEGQRYPVSLTRVQDDPTRAALADVVRGKYAGPDGKGLPSDGGVWFFEIVSRAP